MSETFVRIVDNVLKGHIKISDHGYDELAADGLFVRDLVEGIESGIVVEDYPQYPKGSCVLVLQYDRDNLPVHVVWGIPRNESRPAVLITAYRPDKVMWEKDLKTRRTK